LKETNVQKALTVFDFRMFCEERWKKNDHKYNYFNPNGCPLALFFRANGIKAIVGTQSWTERGTGTRNVIPVQLDELLRRARDFEDLFEKLLRLPQDMILYKASVWGWLKFWR
jgi:hypothetical protein